MLTTTEVFLFIVVPVIVLIILFCAICIIYKKCVQNSNDDQEELFLLHQTNREYNRQDGFENETSFNSKIKSDIGLMDKVNNEQAAKITEKREAAFVYLQFYLRSNVNKGYSLVEHLTTIGRNTDKAWFLIDQKTRDPISKEKLVILKLLVLYRISRQKKLNRFQSFQTKSNFNNMIITNTNQAKLFNELLASLNYPYVMKYDLIDINLNEKYILMIGGFSKDGTLKDLIYSSKPVYEWGKKYRYKANNGLPLIKVKEYSKQIISGLLYLKHKRLPPVSDLHSGNIVMANNKKACLVSGYEYPFIGLESSMSMLFKKNNKKLKKYSFESNNKTKIDYTLLQEVKEILCYGHVVYEMLAGCTLQQLTPMPKDIERIQMSYEPKEFNEIISFLNYVFFSQPGSQTDKSDKLFIPTLEQISFHNFVKDVKINDVGKEINTDCQSAEMIEFVDYVIYRNKEIITNEKNTKLQMKNDFFENNKASLNSNKESSKELSITNQSNKQPSIASPASPPPPPPPPPAPPITNSDPTNLTSSELGNDRASLLSAIRKGTSLKKTITIDKSKPKI